MCTMGVGYLKKKEKKRRGKKKREKEGGINEFLLRLLLFILRTRFLTSSSIVKGDYFTFLARSVLIGSGRHWKKNTTMPYETGGNWGD